MIFCLWLVGARPIHAYTDSRPGRHVPPAGAIPLKAPCSASQRPARMRAFRYDLISASGRLEHYARARARLRATHLEFERPVW